MNKWTLVIIVLIGLGVLAYFLYPILWLLIILIVCIMAYYLIAPRLVPQGHRIKHNMLKSFLKNKYGKDGGIIYKGIVQELRKKGYR